MNNAVICGYPHSFALSGGSNGRPGSWPGWPGAEAGSVVAQVSWPSQTKLRVLRLLRAALSLREIAQELRLSVNTIKSHTRAI